MGGMTSALGLGIILTLQDRVSAGLASIQQKLLSFHKLSDDVVKNFDSGARQIIGGFMSMMAGKKAFDMIDGMFGTSVAVSRSFEMSMARVQAVSGATGNTFNALRDQALEMGRTTRFTAMDAAGAQENLIRTGRNAADTMAMLPSVLKLASAEGLTLTESSDMVSSALRMFNMDASEATRVANVFAETSRSTAANSRMLYQALSYSGGTMGQTLGYNIEQTMAMLGVLHNAVQRGSRAGTGLNQVMTELVNPKKLDKLNALGIQTKSEQGEILPAEMILAQLAQMKKTMGNRDFLAALSPILPTRARNAGTALINALDEANNEYEKLYGKLKAITDAAGEMQSIMDNTSQGAMYRLQSATEALNIALGDQLRGAYDWVIGKTADFKSWITQLIRQFPTLTKIIAGFVAGLLALIGTLLIVTGLMAIFAGSIKIWAAAKIAMGVFFASLKAQAFTAIVALKGMLAPIALLIAAAGLLYAVWRKNLWRIRDLFSAISEGWTLASKANEKGLATMDKATHDRLEKAGILDAVLTAAQVFYRIRELFSGILQGFSQGVQDFKNLGEYLASFFEPFIQSGEKLLHLLGLLKPSVDNHASSWRKAGEIIGRIIPYALTFIAVLKSVKGIISLVNNLVHVFTILFELIVMNPVAVAVIAAIAAVALLYIYWDDFAAWIKAMWDDIAQVIGGVLNIILGIFQGVIGVLTLDWETFCNGIERMFIGVKDIVVGAILFIRDALRPIIAMIEWINDTIRSIKPASDLAQQNLNPNVGESNYEQYRNNLVSAGYILDDKDRVMQLPVELAAMETDEAFKQGIEAKLRELRTAPTQPPQVQSQVPAPPQVQQAPAVQQGITLPPNAQQGGQSAGTIITHQQNQASMNGTANAQAVSQTPINVGVKNEHIINITSSSSDVNIDGEKVGSINHKYEESHQLRQGIFGGWSGASLSGGAE